jgi:TetR/AcrR family transcriptional regulator, lmrAB and yxaGH operons repressor
MTARTQTRERLLHAAATLFRSQGYAATGLSQVLAEGGAPKGVLYFHFPGGKEQLAAEAVALTGRQLCEAISGTLAAAPSPAAGIGQIAKLFGQALEASDFREGCPVATVALDASGGSEAIRASCEGAYRSWADVLERHFLDHGVAGEEAQPLATFALASFEGALLLARVHRNVSPLYTVSATLADMVEKAVNA